MRCRSERPAPLEALRVIVEQSGTPIRSGAGRVLRNPSYLFPIQFSSPKKRASICAKDSAPSALNPNTYKGDYTSQANENLVLGQIPVYHSDKRVFLMEWTANGHRYASHYLLGMPPFSLEQYKTWLSKIAALQNDFDASSVGK
jgi:hypothetical protein